jgi:hypothetical protein
VVSELLWLSVFPVNMISIAFYWIYRVMVALFANSRVFLVGSHLGLARFIESAS